MDRILNHLHPEHIADHSLCPFWFWNDRITPEEIDCQLAMMAEAGVRQAILHARNGLLTDYLSEQWFSDIRHAIATAQRLGMKLWLYDEKDWPSGNCDCEITKDPDNRESFLLFDEVTARRGEPVVFPEPEDAPYLERRCLLNLTLYTENGNSLDLLAQHGQEAADGFTAERDGTVWAVWLATNTYQPLGRLAADYLSERVIGEFIHRTHRRYYQHMGEAFGGTLSGVFMDETRFLNAYPWTADFAEQFRQRKGYDLIPLLPLLWRDDAESATVRYDYFDTVATLMQQHTFRQVYDWCEQHGLKTIAHVLGEETLATQARFNADIMRHYRYMHLPAIDHLGNGIGSLDAKICSSAAHNYGKLTVGAECFGASGWDMDCESVIRITNWLFQQGVNHLIPHAFYYSIRDERANDWPPSYFHQWKDWAKMPDLAAMITRMSGLMQGAVNDTGLLVYYPVESYWTRVQSSLRLQTCYFENGPEILPASAAELDQRWQLLCGRLLNENRDFELINAEAADQFTVQDGRLVNRHTGAAYTAFILANTDCLPDTMVELLNAFTASGGTVLSYNSDAPQVVGTHGQHRTAPETLPTLNTAAASWLRAEDMEQLLALVERYAPRSFRITEGQQCLTRTKMTYPTHLIDPYLHFGEDQSGIGAVVYKKDGVRILDLVNYEPEAQTLTVEVDSAQPPTLYFPETDERRTPDTVQPMDDARYRVSVTVPPNRTVFVFCLLAE